MPVLVQAVACSPCARRSLAHALLHRACRGAPPTGGQRHERLQGRLGWQLPRPLGVHALPPASKAHPTALPGDCGFLPAALPGKCGFLPAALQRPVTSCVRKGKCVQIYVDFECVTKNWRTWPNFALVRRAPSSPPPPPPAPVREGRRCWADGIRRALGTMARATALRGLVGIAAAGGRRVRACGQRWDAGWRGFRAGASGGKGAASRGSSPSRSSAARQAGLQRGAAASAGRKGWVSGGFESEDGKLTCGYSSFIGRRSTMEDCHDIKLTKLDGHPVNLFGVFDGHGGNLAAEYLKDNLFKNLMKQPEFLTDTKLAISRGFLETDEDILETISSSFRDDGSTALAAVVIGKRLYVANVGDSRAVASKAGKAVPLSKDHKPNRKYERKRIEDAGGVVIWDDTWRVGGILAMSRAFGNRMLKDYVIAEPDIQQEEVNSDLEYLILATDGLWDVVRNEDAIALLKAEDGPQAAAVKLTEIAYSRQSTDNITCIVVQFHHDK